MKISNVIALVRIYLCQDSVTCCTGVFSETDIRHYNLPSYLHKHSGNSPFVYLGISFNARGICNSQQIYTPSIIVQDRRRRRNSCFVLARNHSHTWKNIDNKLYGVSARQVLSALLYLSCRCLPSQ